MIDKENFTEMTGKTSYKLSKKRLLMEETENRFNSFKNVLSDEIDYIDLASGKAGVNTGINSININIEELL